jgi:hypothetical protein
LLGRAKRDGFCRREIARGRRPNQVKEILRPGHDSAFIGRLRCGLLRDCTGWYRLRQTPGDLRPGLTPIRSADPDAFIGVNAQLN